MKRNSKCAIYKLKTCTNKDGVTFYDAVVYENIYNPAKPKNWEGSFIKCTIFTELPLEIANFDLDNNPLNKLSFENISNPQNSVIRVLDFSVENHTAWAKTIKNGKDVYTQLKTNDNKPVINQKYYILNCEFDKVGWKSEEAKIKQYEKKHEENKKQISELKTENRTLRKELSQYKYKCEALTEKLNEITKIKNTEIRIPEDKIVGHFNRLEFEDL